MEWKRKPLPVKKKFKTQASVGKTMLTLFWNAQEPILEQCQEMGAQQ